MDATQPPNRAARRAAGQRGPGGVPDLGALKHREDKLAEDIQEEAELKLGLRCGGCKRRFQKGWHFQKVTIRAGQDGFPVPALQNAHACARDDCEYATEVVQEGATVVTKVDRIFADTNTQLRKLLGVQDDDAEQAPGEDAPAEGEEQAPGETPDE